MTEKWEQAYDELVDFIARHPEIKIGESVTSLPADIRPEFYKPFNAVRAALVEEKTPVLINHAREISDVFTKIENDVVEKLAPEGIKMEPRLDKFLHNPIEELMRVVFHLLFDRLKERTDNKTFEQKAAGNIGVDFLDLYRSAYTKWVAISLVSLFKADKLFKATPREFGSSEERTRMRDGLSREAVPLVKESKSILFRFDEEITLLVPDFIIRSSINGKYIGVMANYSFAEAMAPEASKKRKWYPMDSIAPIVPMESDLILIYMGDTLEELALIADVDRICKPDIMIKTRERKGWFEVEGMKRITPHHVSLKPRMGSFVVSREPVPELKPEEKEEGIEILCANLTQAKLQPIVDALTQG